MVNNGGQREFTYTKLLFLFIEGIAGNMEQALLSAAPFFTIKLQRFAKLLRDLEAATLLPKGKYSLPDLASLLSTAVAKLPAQDRAIALADIIKQEPYPSHDPAQAVQSTVFEYMSYGRMQRNDTAAGAMNQ